MALVVYQVKRAGSLCLSFEEGFSLVEMHERPPSNLYHVTLLEVYRFLNTYNMRHLCSHPW